MSNKITRKNFIQKVTTAGGGLALGSSLYSSVSKPDIEHGKKANSNEEGGDRPNILFIIDDDAGYPYTSADGSQFVDTPVFDRVARDGILFSHDFATAPQCAPARASVLTGQHIWQNGPAGTHFSTFPAGLTVYPDILQEHGYEVGHAGKGWGPGSWKAGGRTTPPAGPRYKAKGKWYTKKNPEKKWTKDISIDNYAADFEKFLNKLDKQDEDNPFCFWLGGHEPHRPYVKGSGVKRGKNINSVNVPPYLPDVDTVKSDFLDYAVEIEWLDKQAGDALEALEKRGMLENTLVIYTSDHGAPFPRAKALCFDAGTHIPLAMMWKGGPIKNPGRTVDDLISMVDIFPTILQAAGLSEDEIPASQGKSLFHIFKSGYEGTSDSPLHEYIYWGRERHGNARWLNFGYPQRAIRTHNYLYIWNITPERYPVGAPKRYDKNGSLIWSYYDTDNSPTKSYMIQQHEKVLKDKKKPNTHKLPGGGQGSYFKMAFGKYPSEMLYNIKEDPYCLDNLADGSKFQNVRANLSTILKSKLKLTDDPRMGEMPNIWNSYRRFGRMFKYPAPDWEKERIKSAKEKYRL
jgi:uncharacterized sulfatase